MHRNPLLWLIGLTFLFYRYARGLGNVICWNMEVCEGKLDLEETLSAVPEVCKGLTGGKYFILHDRYSAANIMCYYLLLLLVWLIVAQLCLLIKANSFIVNHFPFSLCLMRAVNSPLSLFSCLSRAVCRAVHMNMLFCSFSSYHYI